MIDPSDPFYPKQFGKWKKRFAFLPHRCANSGKLIWLRFGYKISSTYYSRLSSTYWRDRDVHLIELLKGNKYPIQPIERPSLTPRPPPPRGQK